MMTSFLDFLTFSHLFLVKLYKLMHSSYRVCKPRVIALLF